MYGTIFRLKPKPDRKHDVVEHLEEWNRTLGPDASGVRAIYLLESERRPGELVSVAVFEDEASYRGNAESDQQDRWYLELRDMLDEDPVWGDGTWVVADTFTARV